MKARRFLAALLLLSAPAAWFALASAGNGPQTLARRASEEILPAQERKPSLAEIGPRPKSVPAPELALFRARRKP